MREQAIPAALLAIAIWIVNSPALAADQIFAPIPKDSGAVRLTLGIAPISSQDAVPGRPVGVRVTNVGPPELGGVGYKAGIRVGDIVIKFNDHEVNGPDDLKARLREIQPGSVVPIVIVRGAKEQTLQAHF